MDLESTQLADGIRCVTLNQLSIVLLQSQHCFFVELESHLPKRTWKQIHFDLESHVPLNAEDMSSFVFDCSPTTAVVCDGRKIHELIETNPAVADSSILAVVPEALLHADRYLDSQLEHVVVAGTEYLDSLRIESGQLKNWRWLAASELPNLLTESEESTKLVKAAPSVLLGDTNKCAETEIDSLVESILRGRRVPRCSFADGPLEHVDVHAPARPAMFAMAWTAVAALCLIVGSVTFRASMYRQNAASTIARQQDVFKTVFPKQRIPVGLMSRIDSERRRLLATRDSSQVPRVGSAMPVMRAFLQSVPDSSRFSISSVQFVPQQLEQFVCLAKSFRDLEVLETSLAAQGFVLPGSRARQSPQGVVPQWGSIAWEPEQMPSPSDDQQADDLRKNARE